MIDNDIKRSLQAATFQRLVNHLQNNTDLQNIDLMNLAGFAETVYQNGWLKKQKKNITLDYEEVRSEIYGMNYSEWKKKFQKTN